MSERQQQEALASYLDTIGVLWCHVPNEGKRSKATAALQKRAGLKAGVPDVLIFTVSGRLAATAFATAVRGVAIELKEPRKEPTNPQAQWLGDLARHGWITKVCHSAVEAITWLQSIGYP